MSSIDNDNGRYHDLAVHSARADLLILLNDLARLIRTEADKRARAHGMTRAQWMILRWLERTPGLSQRELAEILEVEPITVGRLVDRLEGRGLVERRPDSRDRRIWRLHLRTDAVPVLAAMNIQRDAITGMLTKGVDEAALDQTARVLLRMKANIGVCRRTANSSDMRKTA